MKDDEPAVIRKCGPGAARYFFCISAIGRPYDKTGVPFLRSDRIDQPFTVGGE